MRTLEATTDSEGNFRIGGIFGAAPCLAPGWLYTLAIAAVGYIPTFTDNEEDDRLAGPLVFGTYQINPIRFWLERLNLYEQFKISPSSDNSAFDKTIETAKAAATHDLTPSGVFATVKNANFNFVTVKSDLIPDQLRQGRWQHTVIIGRESLGRFYAWDSFGKEIAFDSRHEPYNSNLESYGRKLARAEVAASSAAKCETSDGFVVSISRDGGRQFLLASAPPNSILRSQSESIETPPQITITEIVTCAARSDSIYLVLKGQGILRIEFVTPKHKTFKAQVTAFVALKQLNFNSIAVTTLPYERVRTELGFEVVYLVAGDENIYRYNSRLVPDHRIQFVK